MKFHQTRSDSPACFGKTEMHVISHAKKGLSKILAQYLSVVGRIPEGILDKNGMLTDHACFVYGALFFSTESVKTHVLNTVN